MDLFWFLSVILLLMLNSKTFALISCPKAVAVEKGTNYTIKCKVEENVTDFYWYKGKASQQDLVGRLENGIKNIPSWYKDSYDIRVTGALVILNAGIVHEAPYDLVTFDPIGSPEEVEVIVNITIVPDRPCPLINNCTSCKRCQIIESNKSGTFTCKVENTRPQVPLRWHTIYQTGMSVIRYPPQITQSSMSADSWDSSLNLDFEIMEHCGAELVLQCIAKDPLNILQSAVSTIKVLQGQCHVSTSANLPPVVSSTAEKSPLPAVIASVLLALLLTVVVAVSCVLHRRRNIGNTREKKPQSARDEEELLALSSPDHELVTKLVTKLKDGYQKEKLCFLKPLPWVDEIDIAHLYTESLCNVTGEDKETFPEISSDEMLTATNIFEQEFVIFMGEHGDGRTTFLKHIIHEWIEDKKEIQKIRVLIYIPLKKVNADITLSKFVKKEIIKTKMFKSKEIDSILRAKDINCLVILDGLEDKTKSFKKGIRNSTERKKDRNVRSPVTIGALLGGEKSQGYQNLHLWVSSREADCNSVLDDAKDYFTVEMTGFSKKQFVSYVENCSLYYINLAETKGREASAIIPSKLSSDDSASDQDKAKEVNKVSQLVQDFFQKNNILEVFEGSPLLVKLMVHILAAKYAAADRRLKDKNISTIVTLMLVVIECMKERYLNKNPSYKTKDFSDLEEILGKVAMKDNLQESEKKHKIWVKEIGEKYVTAGHEIGFLKLTEDSLSKPKFSRLEFHHEYIQEYLAASYILKSSRSFPEEKQKGAHYGVDKIERIKEFIKELRSCSQDMN